MWTRILDSDTQTEYVQTERDTVCAANDTTIFNKRKFTRFHRTIKLHTGNQNGFFLFVSHSHICMREKEKENESEKKKSMGKYYGSIETNCKLAKWRLKEWKWISINPNWHHQYCKWICNVLLTYVHPSSFDSVRLKKFTQKSSCRAFAISEPHSLARDWPHNVLFCFEISVFPVLFCSCSVHLLLLFLNLAKKETAQKALAVRALDMTHWFLMCFRVYTILLRLREKNKKKKKNWCGRISGTHQSQCMHVMSLRFFPQFENAVILMNHSKMLCVCVF